MSKPEELLKRALSRRSFVTGLGTTAGAAALLATGCGGSGSSSTTSTTTAAPSGPSDADILNFALNLEYLEAEYYLRALTGSGLSSADAGSGAGTVTGGTAVPFADARIKALAAKVAEDELAHVRFLRKALGSSAVDRPTIDLMTSFQTAATAAGITNGATFNPFADEISFLLGAFIFEDVGVTAYHGAAGLLTDKGNLAAAAGIYATEAYHAGMIRTLLVHYGPAYVSVANQISTLRGTASSADGKSNPAETALTSTTIVASDSNSIAYDRNTDEVLRIVYLGATGGVVSKGGFFPNGLNGNITASAS